MRNFLKTLKNSVFILSFLVFSNFVVVLVSGHGRLLKPPGRSTLWRVDEFRSLNPPVNYDDAQIYCGGQHQRDNPGRSCGVCGDPLGMPSPRPNEIGGRFYRGIIAGQYESGGLMYVEAQITAPHMGFMEFRLCTNPKWETQDCFDQNVLQIGDGSGTRMPVGHQAGTFWLKLRIPENVTCEHCILQWNYRAGNNWGMCPDGEGRLGCGSQETFRACSDVRIVPRSSKTPNKILSVLATKEEPRQVPTSPPILITPVPNKLSTPFNNEVDVDADSEGEVELNMSNELKAYLLKLLRKKGKDSLLQLLGEA